jgi:septal ring factor EnvC (AmiA/AmiB activator)
MDQSIITALGGSSIGILLIGVIQLSNIALQLYQMFLDAQKANNHKQVKDFQEQINLLTKKLEKNESKIESLEKEIYELHQENAELRGLLQAQENKEELIQKFIKKQSKQDK